MVLGAAIDVRSVPGSANAGIGARQPEVELAEVEGVVLVLVDDPRAGDAIKALEMPRLHKHCLVYLALVDVGDGDGVLDRVRGPGNHSARGDVGEAGGAMESYSGPVVPVAIRTIHRGCRWLGTRVLGREVRG